MIAAAAGGFAGTVGEGLGAGGSGGEVEREVRRMQEGWSEAYRVRICGVRRESGEEFDVDADVDVGGWERRYGVKAWMSSMMMAWRVLFVERWWCGLDSLLLSGWVSSLS